MLQELAQGGIQILYLLHMHTLAVRWIRHQQHVLALLAFLFCCQSLVRYVGLLELYILGDTSRLGVLLSKRQRTFRHVTGVNLVRELPLLAVVFIQLLEQLLVEVMPFLKGKTVSEDAWRNVQGYQSGFNDDSSASAHWIDEVTLSVPSCHQQHSRCHGFTDGCLVLHHSVSTLVQALARAVQTQRAVVPRYVNVHNQVWIRQSHRRTFTFFLHEVVGYRIFDPVRHEP